MKVRYAVKSNIGSVRKNNQDNFFADGCFREDLSQNETSLRGTVTDFPCLFALCDGMGGTENGEVASMLACRSLSRFENFKFFDNRYTMIIKALNQLVHNYTEVNGLNVCGTTLAAVLIDKTKAYAYNVGDTPVFLFRHGMLSKLTKDDTLYERYRELGVEIPRGKNSLMQFIGMDTTRMDIKPHRSIVENLKVGDIIYICSDGVINALSEDYIKNILGSDLKPHSKADMLIDECLYNNCRDNVTVEVIEIVE